MKNYILAIDQGTTSSRAIIFNRRGLSLAASQHPIHSSYPHEGWVEQNPQEIWEITLRCCKEVMQKAAISADQIAAIGISNQRETTVVWDKKTGEAIYPAIVWQDRRTAQHCHDLGARADIASLIQNKTGLLLDPYFSATKLTWILDHVSQARKKAERGELLFGTIDCYLIWRLTRGRSHVTDVTNASRTLLFNTQNLQWDQELLKLFHIPESVLPRVTENVAEFGVCDREYFGHEIPICGVAGDQQAAAIGQCCFLKGMTKSTYGTGCFILMNTGDERIISQNRLISTVLYQINQDVTYGLEGSIFNAGTAIQWLRDTLRLIQDDQETETLAQSLNDNGGVYLIPAFTGLGAPYWDPNARAAVFGLTRDAGIAHLARAALEAIAFQTMDLIQAFKNDYSKPLVGFRVDGGMAKNNWLMQFLANLLMIEIHRPQCIETSALGAAFLAGLGAGFYSDLQEIANLWQEEQVFVPSISETESRFLQWYDEWRSAVSKVLTQ